MSSGVLLTENAILYFRVHLSYFTKYVIITANVSLRICETRKWNFCWKSLQVGSSPELMQVLYHVSPACETMIISTIITSNYILLFLLSYKLIYKDILKIKLNI